MPSMGTLARYGIYLLPAAIPAVFGCAPSQEITSPRFVATIGPLAMALGLIFLSWTDGYTSDAFTYLFGSLQAAPD